MGSGSSKEKQPQPRKADNVSKPTKPQLHDSRSKQTTLDAQNDGLSNTQKGGTDTNRTTGYNNNTNYGKVTDSSNRGIKNDHVQNNGNNKLGKFESDSESEGEDINAVLEATKNEYNRTMQERNRPTTNTMYPESYAQRLQREQYRNEPQGLIRQKTIYRNPDEWEVDDNEMDSFDVSKFKQANVQDKPLMEQSSQINRDIFSPSVPDSKPYKNMMDYEDSNQYERKKSLPHYDTSEEALLDEIEKEYEL